MGKMKELLCCKEVLHQMSEDFMVQSRHEEVEGDKEIVIFFWSVIGRSHPESDCVLRCFFRAVVADKYMINMQVTLCCRGAGREPGSAKAACWCKAGVSTTAAAEPPLCELRTRQHCGAEWSQDGPE